MTCRLIPRDLDNNEIVFCRYFVTSFIIGFCIFLGVLYHLNFLALLVFSFIIQIFTRLFLNGANKQLLKRNKLLWRKCYLLIYVFVTLSMNKISGSENFSLLYRKTKIRKSFYRAANFAL